MISAASILPAGGESSNADQKSSSTSTKNDNLTNSLRRCNRGDCRQTRQWLVGPAVFSKEGVLDHAFQTSQLRLLNTAAMMPANLTGQPNSDPSEIGFYRENDTASLMDLSLMCSSGKQSRTASSKKRKHDI